MVGVSPLFVGDGSVESVGDEPAVSVEEALAEVEARKMVNGQVTTLVPVTSPVFASTSLTSSQYWELLFRLWFGAISLTASYSTNEYALLFG